MGKFVYIFAFLVSLAMHSVQGDSMQETLESLHDRDQVNRFKLQDLKYGSEDWEELWEVQNAIDEANTRQLKSIFIKHGWPKNTELGQKASLAAFLILQPAKPAFQKKYVNLFRDAVNQGEAQLRFLAFLEDSLLMHEGKPQKYGSQLMRDEEGILKLWPNENEEETDSK